MVRLCREPDFQLSLIAKRHNREIGAKFDHLALTVSERGHDFVQTASHDNVTALLEVYGTDRRFAPVSPYKTDTIDIDDEWLTVGCFKFHEAVHGYPSN